MARKKTWTDQIPLHRAREIDAAYRYAGDVLGCPLNYYLTVNWGECGLSDPFEIEATMLTFLDGAGRWIKRHGQQWVQITVRENSGEDPRGEHFHMALHCPSWLAKAFKAYCRHHLKPAKANAIKLKPAPAPSDLVRGYFLKGGTFAVYDEYGEIICAVTNKAKRQGQGRIYGQRVFISRAINAKAQKRGRTVRLATDQTETERYHLVEAKRLAAELGIPLPSQARESSNEARTFAKQCRQMQRWEKDYCTGWWH